jgi:hypothetical protein
LNAHKKTLETTINGLRPSGEELSPMRKVTSKRGVFIISLDLELAWGLFDLWGSPDAGIPQSSYDRYLQTREVVIDALLRLFQEYQVSATWAIVGHLFLDHCQTIDGVKHPDMPRPTHRWFKRDWYAWDPASTLERDPAWYGRDIVKKIMAAEPRQDIGCHSFSHVVFGDEGCSAQVAEAEIAKCVALAREMGIDPKSFVFPRNREGHYQILKDYGFSCYRVAQPGWANIFRGQAQRWAKFGNDMLGLSPPCAAVEEKLPGLWSISSSAYYRPAHGSASIIPMYSRVRQGIKGITKAIDAKGIFHLYLHPSGLGFKTEVLLGGLKGILQYAEQKRQEGELDLLSMAQLAEQLEAANRTGGRHQVDPRGGGRRVR